MPSTALIPGLALRDYQLAHAGCVTNNSVVQDLEQPVIALIAVSAPLGRFLLFAFRSLEFSLRFFFDNSCLVNKATIIVLPF